MNRRPGSKSQPFPRRRPEIVITPSRATPFAVDCRELPWWFCLPEVGNRVLWTIYDPPDWKLTSVTEMRVLRPAEIHQTDGVEIEVNEWEPETGWRLGVWTVYGRLTEDAVQWLATDGVVDGKRVLRTFLDEGFEDDWWGLPRPIKPDGRLARREDGSYTQTRPCRSLGDRVSGAGAFHVRIGERAFACLRVIDVGAEPSERDTLVEAYLTRNGRTVLFRRYNGRQWGRQQGKPYGDKPPWDERFPDHSRIVLDGATFVHWYDSLPDFACGIGG
jgi:hypothetical protein